MNKLYPSFEKGEFIIVEASYNRKLNGKFIEWIDDENDSSKKTLFIQLTYESYIFNLAFMLISDSLTLEQFFQEITKERYELAKDFYIEEKDIFKINNIILSKV